MSTWRRKAIECLPDLKKDFEQDSLSIYSAFHQLVEATVKAHKNNDSDSLKKYYDFAEWCFNQKNKELWNAAGVSFYEHLGDYDETFLAMHLWVKPKIYNDVRGLLERMISDDKMKILDASYGIQRGKEKRG